MLGHQRGTMDLPITSDGALADEIRALGATVTGPPRFRRLLGRSVAPASPLPAAATLVS